MSEYEVREIPSEQLEKQKKRPYLSNKDKVVADKADSKFGTINKHGTINKELIDSISGLHNTVELIEKKGLDYYERTTNAKRQQERTS